VQDTPDTRAVIVCDACVLINFLIIDRLDLLSRNARFCFVVTEHVTGEITDPVQSAALRVALQKVEIEQVDLTDPEGLVLFAELRKTLGKGESAAIALAARRGWAVATDDSQTRREIERRLGKGRLLTTPGILVEAIHSEALTVEGADEIKARLEAHRFRMNFGSFAEIV